MRGRQRLQSAATTAATTAAALILPNLLQGNLLLILLVSAQQAHGLQDVVGIAGRTVELPCHLHSPKYQDRAILALWYKGDRKPVYSWDARKPDNYSSFSSDGYHKANQELLNGRAKFLTNRSPATLILEPVRPEDSGVYTCRVDFQTSPTANTVVNLTVIEPPVSIMIQDKKGTEIRQGQKLGPINEGSPLTLSCLVRGGRPPPTVSWFGSKVMLEQQTVVVTRSNYIQADLVIPELTRSDHQKTFTCHAKNNNKINPLNQDVEIIMNLRPLSTKIILPDSPLVANSTTEFTCESQGSKPQAQIRWKVNGEYVDPTLAQQSHLGGDITTSKLRFVPQASDNNATITCEAQNPRMQVKPIKEDRFINVQYQPIVSLTLGKSIDSSNIKQGDDVYFECKVDANPPPTRVVWYRDDKEIRLNKSGGVIVQDTSLALQNLHRSSAGNYQCTATNYLGTTHSNTVTLDVKYAPVCMVDQPTVLAVGRGEKVDISCRVASNPMTATFQWSLNGSENVYKSAGVRIGTDELASTYQFLGTSDKDYGTLLCWANNSIGEQQQHKCVFQIIPAGPPSSPENCVILNHTAENIQVGCIGGFDGGMRQMFLAEVYDEGGELHSNTTDFEPEFSVGQLQPGATYIIKVSAFNDKGRSQPVPITAYTLKVAEKRMGSTEFQLNSPLLIIFLSIMGVFVVVILILVIATRWRKQNDSTTSAIFTTVSTASSPKLEASPQENPAITQVTEEQNTEPKPKPKKKVVLVENGMNDSRSLGDAMNEMSTSKDALLGRGSGEKQPLVNGSAGYYNSLGKTSIPSTAATSSSSSSTLPRPSILTNKMTTAPIKRSVSPPARPTQEYATYTRYCDSLPRRSHSSSINNPEVGNRRSVIGAENFRELDAYLRRSGSGGVYHAGSGSGLDRSDRGVYRAGSGTGLDSSSYRNSMIESSGRFSTYHDRHPGSIGAIDTYHLDNQESGRSPGACIGMDVYRSPLSDRGSIRGSSGLETYRSPGSGRSPIETYRSPGSERSPVGILKVTNVSGINPYQRRGSENSPVSGVKSGIDTYRGSGNERTNVRPRTTASGIEPYRSPPGGGTRGESYHVMEDLKTNPKYVVRTRSCKPDDESFV